MSPTMPRSPQHYGYPGESDGSFGIVFTTSEHNQRNLCADKKKKQLRQGSFETQFYQNEYTAEFLSWRTLMLGII